MSDVIEIHQRQKKRWVELHSTDKEVLDWITANPPPEVWGARPPLEWAYYHAPRELLVRWGRPDLPPLSTDAPKPLTEIPVPSLDNAPSWFEPASKNEPPTPLIKMPGSKRWLVPALWETVVEYLESTRGGFFEPFAGSGALSLAMGSKGIHCTISDASRDLMEILAATKDSPLEFWKGLEIWVNRGILKEQYLAARRFKPTTGFSRAIRALYLLRLSFNGLWRVNSKGEFNVPYGRATTRSFPSLEAIDAVSHALAPSQVFVEDFRSMLPHAQEGDVVYLDPPYYGTFVGYTAGGFTLKDAAELAKLVKETAERNVAVIISSPADPQIAAGYDWAYTAEVPRKHIVAAKATDRAVYSEAIYTNRPDLVALSKLDGYIEEEIETETPTDEDNEVRISESAV